ncbi:MAG: type II toxin-antitoxin system Phd/YefM family antitoxin [Legionellales bacterium]|nr:type II toxin-antitoxin system Phd/YefM family antitoxin [Legionellales bacterium]
MTVMNIHQAKTHFSQLVDEAMRGEEVIISKAGTPILKLVPLHVPKFKRIPGALKGKITMADDFDAPLPDDFLDTFEDES